VFLDGSRVPCEIARGKDAPSKANHGQALGAIEAAMGLNHGKAILLSADLLAATPLLRYRDTLSRPPPVTNAAAETEQSATRQQFMVILQQKVM